jgi:hypothetical protein
MDYLYTNLNIPPGDKWGKSRVTTGAMIKIEFLKRKIVKLDARIQSWISRKLQAGHSNLIPFTFGWKKTSILMFDDDLSVHVKGS